jgi:hypothetical protein
VLVEARLRQAIRDKITAGTLPADPPRTVWAGMGSGRPCSACGEPIRASDTEIELETAREGVTIRLHRDCFNLWRDECGYA